jgi:hypothetical protein
VYDIWRNPRHKSVCVWRTILNELCFWNIIRLPINYERCSFVAVQDTTSGLRPWFRKPSVSAAVFPVMFPVRRQFHQSKLLKDRRLTDRSPPTWG